jgi:hypothetical protein
VQQYARRYGGEDGHEDGEHPGHPLAVGRMPLFEQFVDGLGDPVVDRVAEAVKELLVG